jgi:hypothetical protein
MVWTPVYYQSLFRYVFRKISGGSLRFCKVWTLGRLYMNSGPRYKAEWSARGKMGKWQ